MAYRSPDHCKLRYKPSESARQDYTKSNANAGLPPHKPFMAQFGRVLMGAPDSPECREDAAQRIVDHVCGCMGIPSVEIRVLDYKAPHSTGRDGVVHARRGGDYAHEGGSGVLIQVFNRTPVRGSRVFAKSFLCALCHQLAHHIDVAKLGIITTPHTAGFYSRVNALSGAFSGRNARDRAEAAENAARSAGTVTEEPSPPNGTDAPEGRLGAFLANEANHT